MNDGELKPCPFCGGEAEIDNDANGYEWVTCGECSASTVSERMSADTQGHIKSWNKRVKSKQSDQYGKGKVKEFDPKYSVSSDDVVLTARHVKRFNKEEL